MFKLDLHHPIAAFSYHNDGTWAGGGCEDGTVTRLPFVALQNYKTVKVNIHIER
jgi:hypothetical protein